MIPLFLTAIPLQLHFPFAQRRFFDFTHAGDPPVKRSISQPIFFVTVRIF